MAVNQVHAGYLVARQASGIVGNAAAVIEGGTLRRLVGTEGIDAVGGAQHDDVAGLRHATDAVISVALGKVGAAVVAVEEDGVSALPLHEVEAAGVGAHPEAAFRVGEQRVDVVVAQREVVAGLVAMVGNGEPLAVGVEFKKAVAARPHPQSAVALPLGHAVDAREDRFLRADGAVAGQVTAQGAVLAAQGHASVVVGLPDVSLLVGMQHLDVFAGIHHAVGLSANDNALQGAVFGASPYDALRIGVGSRHLVVGHGAFLPGDGVGPGQHVIDDAQVESVAHEVLVERAAAGVVAVIYGRAAAFRIGRHVVEAALVEQVAGAALGFHPHLSVFQHEEVDDVAFVAKFLGNAGVDVEETSQCNVEEIDVVVAAHPEVSACVFLDVVGARVVEFVAVALTYAEALEAVSVETVEAAPS